MSATRTTSLHPLELTLATASAAPGLVPLVERGAVGAPLMLALVAVLLAFGLVVFGRGPLVARVLLAAVSSTLCAAAGALPDEGLTLALRAQAQGQAPLLLLRAELTVVGALLLRALRVRDRRLAVAALPAALFASLFAQAALPLLALVVVVEVGRARLPRRAPPRPLALLGAPLLALVAGVALSREHVDVRPQDDAALARYWLARENPFRARLYAQRWAAEEQLPSTGALALARIALELGDVEAAALVLDDVGGRTPHDEVRREAEALRARLP